MTETDQKFSASFAKDATYKDGLRDFLEYRDLGIEGASAGQFRAHVMRVKDDAGDFDLHTTGLHRHHLDFQMIYILKGWIKFTYEGQGEYTFGPGDCCMQPAGIVHNELACSDDLELLEITSPANYTTATIEGQGDAG
jgi:mannose-6-phosphate isomerase-like protein (cupin superfamily)